MVDRVVVMKTKKRWIERKRRPRFALEVSRWIAAALAGCFTLAVLSGCDVERRKSDAELGLTPQQAAGRKLYDNYCDRCHRPYSTKGKKGPGLKGVFQNRFLPQTGLPANDERVVDIIRSGRPDMPGYNQVLSQQDIQELLAYMHTL
ncbi:MAG TPA: cytochrome c [Candidatus Acidoferrum sp.]|jgi:mono/diheme cytochrome c family protein|nr:cytochrome c [Candidatus Acidoferrum sp.]